MLVVLALGGNALLKRGEPLTAERQLANVREAARRIADIAEGHQLVVAHGNGPQVGLLALQNAAYTDVPPYPLDVLDAQSEGMIGYLLEQEIGNRLPSTRTVATLLTRVEVDRHDPAFNAPSKPIGPLYTQQQAQQLAADRGWAIAADGNGFRRVVPSPVPKRIVGLQSIRWLLEHHAVVIAAGGGGIPVVRGDHNSHALSGVEAVIDKDLCAAVLARELRAERFLIATDVDAVYVNWQRPDQRALASATPTELRRHAFAAGSMGPKVEAACRFVEYGTGTAVIGALTQIDRMLSGGAGTRITRDMQR